MSASATIQVSNPDIEFVGIPATVLRVSRVALGTWAMGVEGWSLNTVDRALIDLIVNTVVKDPVGPEFMAPPPRPHPLASPCLA